MNQRTVDHLRELDILIAKEVMGWEELDSGFLTAPASSEVPYYSIDITAAWSIVEKLREKWFVSIKLKPAGDYFSSNDGDIKVSAKCVIELFRRNGNPSRLLACHETEAIAICVAALRSIGIEPRIKEFEG